MLISKKSSKKYKYWGYKFWEGSINHIFKNILLFIELETYRRNGVQPFIMESPWKVLATSRDPNGCLLCKKWSTGLPVTSLNMLWLRASSCFNALNCACFSTFRYNQFVLLRFHHLHHFWDVWWGMSVAHGDQGTLYLGSQAVHGAKWGQTLLHRDLVLFLN